ncbi:hypothetical protein BYT27DRAFT_6740956 [Phlegmacium glaucopus]|nr:hypothetical protein BYT27DRAFT_6740956 [Phlegmacium glaucopus]
MTDLQIPPPGVKFRLLNKVTDYVIYARYHPDPHVYACPVADKYDDQYFTIIRGIGDLKDQFLFKSVATNMVLYSRNSSPYVDQAGGLGVYADNWFRLDTSPTEPNKYFRLLTPCNNLVIFSRFSPDPHFGNFGADNVYDDQYWSFLMDSNADNANKK